MFVLATSRIDLCVKSLMFSFFSEKSPNFSKKLWFWLILAENSRFFAEKWKYQNFETNFYSTVCKGQHIRKWAKSDYLVMSCYVFRNFSQITIFSMGCWFLRENHPYFTEFSLFCILDYHFKKIFTKFVFWSNLQPIWTFLGWSRAIFSPKSAIFGSLLHQGFI